MKRLFIFFFLFVGQSSFAQTSGTSFGKPIFWYRVSDPWAMFMGAEGSIFILYNNGKLLFWKNGAYNLTQLDEDEKSQVISDLDLTVSETFLSFKAQLAFSTESLKQIFDATVKDADQALINNTEYLQAWGLESKPAEAREIFTHLLAKITAANQSPCDSEALNYIFKNGTLARRLEKSLTANTVFAVYQKLSRCLFNNTPFEC